MDTMTPAKRKILVCAVELFAVKGYSDTSVRDIAAAAMIKSASLYNHFTSKEDILTFMMKDYIDYTAVMFDNPDLSSIIEKNPTADGILSSIPRVFMMLEDKYYSTVIRVLFHEQFRNEIVRGFFNNMLQSVESFIENVFNELKKLNVICSDADPTHWKKAFSTLFYALPARMMLSAGQNLSDFSDVDPANLLRYMFNVILNMYGVSGDQDAHSDITD